MMIPHLVIWLGIPPIPEIPCTRSVLKNPMRGGFTICTATPGSGLTVGMNAMKSVPVRLSRRAGLEIKLKMTLIHAFAEEELIIPEKTIAGVHRDRKTGSQLSLAEGWVIAFGVKL
jgi:hypothetical protein